MTRTLTFLFLGLVILAGCDSARALSKRMSAAEQYRVSLRNEMIRDGADPFEAEAFTKELRWSQ